MEGGRKLRMKSLDFRVESSDQTNCRDIKSNASTLNLQADQKGLDARHPKF